MPGQVKKEMDRFYGKDLTGSPVYAELYFRSDVKAVFEAGGCCYRRKGNKE